jgi:hypothetical protein
MSDIRVNSYRAAQQYSNQDDKNVIYNQLPDQFYHFEDQPKNSFDFFTSSGEFNLALFNKTYREEQLKRISFYRRQEKERLEKLSKSTPPPPVLHQLSVGQHILNMKDRFFETLYDIQRKPLDMKIFTVDNRMFYLGMLIIIMFFIYASIKHFMVSSYN